MVAKYTIERGAKVAKILKLAFRATRQAMYSENGDDHILEVRALLDTLTDSNADVVAQGIVELVKDDLGE